MPSSSKNDNNIQRRIHLNDPGEFQNIYNQFYLAVFRFIFGLHGGPVEEVEDLTMTTFTRAWKSRNRFQGTQGAALGWLLQIARNLVIDQFRSRKKQSLTVDISTLSLPSNDQSPEEKVIQIDQVNVLIKLLKRIPDEHREIIVLRYILGWKVNRIAAHLGKKDNTISVLIRRILQRIQIEWPEV